MGGMVDHVFYFMFVLIMVFLVATNYKGLTEIMKQGGASGVPIIKALQGR
jgi:hypothetical protein